MASFCRQVKSVASRLKCRVYLKILDRFLDFIVALLGMTGKIVLEEKLEMEPIKKYDCLEAIF